MEKQRVAINEDPGYPGVYGFLLGCCHQFYMEFTGFLMDFAMDLNGFYLGLVLGGYNGI